jgi:hypothetical protein
LKIVVDIRHILVYIRHMEETPMTQYVVVNADGTGIFVMAASKQRAMAQVLNSVDAWRD